MISDITAATFFRTWFEELAGWLVLWSQNKRDGKAKRVVKAFSGANYAEEAEIHAMELAAQGFDVHFGVCPLGFKPADGARGSAEDTCSMPGVWVEIDHGTSGHKARNLPPDLTAAQTLVAKYPHPPTMIVHSGGGIHCYWKFPTPMKLDDAASREQARAMTDRFQNFFRRPDVNPHNYHLDGTADLARVLRVPGTHNFKELHK